MRKQRSNLRKFAVVNEDEKGEIRMKALARRTIRVIEKRDYAPSLHTVRQVAQELLPKEDPEAIVQAISKERYKRAREFFETLWPLLGVFSPPSEVEEALQEGRGVSLWLSQGRKWTEVHLLVEGKLQKSFSLRRRIPIPLSIDSQITRLRAVVDDVYVEARGGKANAFLRTTRGEKRALEAVRYFRPLLEVLNLADLEKALDPLANLPPWEKSYVRGRYLMVKSPYLSVLRRGLVLGDPALDGAFFRGKPVVLSYPEGVEVFLRATFFHEGEEPYKGFGKLEAKIEWRGEVVPIRRDVSMRRWDFLHPDPITSILRHELSMASFHDPNSSPAMSVFLRELGNQESILKALGDKEFHRKVWREIALEALASF